MFLANDEKWVSWSKEAEVEVEADQVPPRRFDPLVVRSETTRDQRGGHPLALLLVRWVWCKKLRLFLILPANDEKWDGFGKAAVVEADHVHPES
jgi:hypothetical protein